MPYVFDLTMPINEETPTYTGDPEQEIEKVATVGEDGYAVKRLSFPSHFSTHFDAPSHMIAGGKSLDEYPVGKFVGDAVVVDVRGQELIDSAGGVSGVDMVFFRTGRSQRAYEEDYHDDVPVLTEDTAEELAKSGVDVVGIDSPSPDTEPFPVHDTLLSNDVLILENLVNLGAVQGKVFRCYALPLPVDDADGAPCRVVGVVG
jgi:arylformamidase